MMARVAFRHLVHRPLRTAFLLLGYGLGVGVMLVLLSIGEALLVQAADERLIGGGDLTVLPEGIDVEVMKTGGVGGMFFSIEQSRFVYRQLLGAPRLRGTIAVAAPQIEGKLLYLQARGQEYAVRGSGEIPSLSARVGAAPSLIAGEWRDDDGDRRWMSPSPHELYAEIDRFHETPSGVDNRQSWGEWHYFNILLPGEERWIFVSFMLRGDVPDGEWDGNVEITLREQGGSTRRFRSRADPSQIEYSLHGPDLRVGVSRVALLPDGRYHIRARAREANGPGDITVDAIVSPVAGAYFPGTELASGRFVSGYAVAALRADASGTVCIANACQRFEGAQAYHDHNWGVWRGVTWDWGAGRAGDFTFLYGRVQPPDSLASTSFYFALIDSLGFRALFRPSRIDYQDARVIVVAGRRIHVPASARMFDIRGHDTLEVVLTIDDAIGTDIRGSFTEREDRGDAATLRTPYFIQMKGRTRLRATVGGELLSGEGVGFFETYR